MTDLSTQMLKTMSEVSGPSIDGNNASATEGVKNDGDARKGKGVKQKLSRQPRQKMSKGEGNLASAREKLKEFQSKMTSSRMKCSTAVPPYPLREVCRIRNPPSMSQMIKGW